MDVRAAVDPGVVLNRRTPYLLRRSAQAAVLLAVLVVINFFLIHAAPGDPVHILAGQSGDEQYYEFIRSRFGLDRPLGTQLIVYASNIVRGDLGYSLQYQQPVAAVVLSRVLPTLLLMLTALLLSSVIGILLATEAVRRENSLYDRFVTGLVVVPCSVPSFCMAQVLILVFSLHLQLFPAQGISTSAQDLDGLAHWFDVLHHLALPAVTLVLMQLATIQRLTRAEISNVVREDFITTARIKGLSETRVLYGHALRAALLPVVTVIGTEAGSIFSGAVLIETVFAWPGLGRLLLDAIAARDYPVLMGTFLIVSAAVIVTNLVADLAYSLFDPRVQYT